MALAVLTSLFETLPAQARSRDVITTDWSGFQREASTRKIAGRSVQITLVSGTEFKTKLISVAGDALVVQANSATAQWASRERG